ncbi:hypothetical protein GLOIN_2v1847961 [Rhizophagus irregularis DAOM 181602=DAOM 197198]|nr:hypothetical protein GLOIN_2v1847961 [Rhizophagus irregularis DAOM 181602=DAOM 197198]
MSDIYDELEEIKNRHEIEKHNELRKEYQVDPSCIKCYSTDEIEIGDWFKRFWKIFQKVILEAMSYNRNTYMKLMEYIVLTKKDEEESYPSSRKKRNKEFEKIRKEGEKLLDIVVRSISEDNEYILDDRTEENLLGNKELLTYRYIIEDNELDIRFAKFEEWLEKIESVTIKNKGYGTMKNFKEILHLEENIAEEENREKIKKFQKSITYQWWDGNKYPRPWMNDDLTDKIIEKIVETKGFVEEQSDVGELESSDDLGESSSNEGDEHIERIYRNYWLENGYEIDIEEIRRIINFKVEYEIIKTKEFMSFYKTIEELDDKGIEEELRIWHYMYTIECPTCNKIILKKEAIEAVEYNKEFIERICKSCYEKELENVKDENELDDETEIEKRLEQLKNLIKVLEIEVSDGELLRLMSMGYRNVDILSADFIRKFQEYKNESEKEIKRILDEYLKKFEIEESEEEVEEENDDTDNSEKIGEILDPEEYEIWEENTEDFNKNEFENENENVINTGGFGLNQNSDSNNSLNIKDSDNESEISDYNLQDLFQENILLNMATEAQIRRIVENATGLAPNALDNALGAGQTLLDRIQTAGMGGIVGMPTFSGKEDEDVNDWIRQFEVAFTVSGRTEGNVGGGVCSQNKANVAITCLRGTALQWYNEEKERVAANLVNWCDHNDDRNLKNKLINRFTREDVKRRKMMELTRIKQEKNESVEEYTRRFRSILRIATRGQALHDMYQVNYYIQGLEPTLGYQVRRSSPTNLNDAINTARREEEAKNELIMKTTGVNIEQIRQEKNIEEILKEETNKKEENEIYKKMQKPVNEKDIDELSKALEQFRAEKIAMEETLNEIKNQQRRNINRNTNTRNARIMRCYECNEVGHIRPECPQLRQRNNYRTQNNFNRNNNERRNNNNNNRNINLMDHERYYDNNRYNDNEYYNNHEIYNYEKEIFPTLRSGRKYGRDLDNDYNEMEIEDVPIPPKREYDMKMDIDGERKGGFSNKEDRDKAYQSRRRHNRCERCGVTGHFIRECPNPGMKRGNKNIRVRVNVPPEKYVMDMYNEKANITYGQIYNENPKFRRIARNYNEDDNA